MKWGEQPYAQKKTVPQGNGSVKAGLIYFDALSAAASAAKRAMFAATLFAFFLLLAFVVLL